MIKKLLRIIIAVIAGIFLLWFIAPIFWGIRHIGCMVGVVLCLAVLFRTACSPLYHRLKDKLLEKKATKVLLRIVQVGACCVLIYCIVISSIMVFAMTSWGSSDSTAVVLGAQVMPWGASPLLRQRINAAEDYLNANPDAVAVVTGGQGANEPMSEADCMYENMVQDGIDPQRIYREDQAKNTDENIRFSLEVIDNNKLSRDIAIVTDSYHQLRAKIITHKCDNTVNITPVNTANNNIVAIAAYPSYFVREWLAIPVEIIK